MAIFYQKLNFCPNAACNVHDRGEGGDGRLRLVLMRRVVPLQEQGTVPHFQPTQTCYSTPDFEDVLSLCTILLFTVEEAESIMRPAAFRVSLQCQPVLKA